MDRCNSKPWLLTAISLLLTVTLTAGVASADMGTADGPASEEPAVTPPSTSAADLPAKRKIPPKVYSWNPADYTYHRIGGNNRSSSAVGGELLGYKTVPDAKPEENPVELLGFLVLTSDDGKESYYLTPTQLYSKERGVLDATPQQCKVLHVMAKANNASEKGNAQWLRYMSPEKLNEIKFSGIALDDAVTNISFVTAYSEDMALPTALSNLAVQPNATTKFEKGVSPNPSSSAEAMTIKLTFNTGVVYDVWIFEDFLYIFSSDMEYSLGYRMMPDKTAEQRNAQAQMVRTMAETDYYRLHPELKLPERFNANPDT